MDLSSAGAGGRNKIKRVSSDELEEDDPPKKTCLSLPTGVEAGCGTGAEHFLDEIRPQIESWIGEVVFKRIVVEFLPQIQQLFRQQVREEIDSIIQSKIHSLLSKTDEIVGKAITTPSGTLKLKLCFSNSIDSIIFTNNEIKAKNGEALKVEICDVTNSNSVVSTGPLSCAQIEFFILDGDFYSSQRRDGIIWTPSDFNTSILTPRSGKRPLIIGSDAKLFLKNGVGIIKNLIITDGSFWVRSGQFCLGAKLIDEKILAEHLRIGEAVSQPFRVMDQRSEVNQKQHTPSWGDNVWQLKGIAKNGIYHKNLSSEGIETVGDFLTAYRERGPDTLKMLLGKRVLKKTWEKMVKNAEECVDVPTSNQTNETNLVENEVVEGEVFNDNNDVERVDVPTYNQIDETHLVENEVVGEEASSESMEKLLSLINFEVDASPSLLLHGETCSTSHELDYKPSTQTQYY